MAYFRDLERSEKRKAEEKKKPKIAICIPHQETVYMRFAVDTLMQLAKEVTWCDKVCFFLLGYSIGLQRDNLVRTALEQNADYV